MARSDLSGSSIEADANAEVIVRLADGRARRLTVTAAEAEGLAGKGQPIGGLRHGIGSFVLRNWKSVGWWAFGLLVATVLLPAATKQWSDRQAALVLKNSLISEINASTVKAWLAGERILQTTDDKQVSKLRAKALEDWFVEESAIDSKFALYFPSTRAQDRWISYRSAVYDYVQHACCAEPGPSDTGPNGPSNPGPLPVAGSMQAYFQHYSPSTHERLLGLNSDFWEEILRSSPNRDPAIKNRYQEVGRDLLQQRQSILNAVRTTPANGFSDGWIDYWRDVIPGW